MRGKEIPLITVYTIEKRGHTTKKRVPLYELQPAEVVRAKQEALGDNVGWYYGDDCNKCCGVFPAFETETGFDSKCYFVCLVCGKESIHCEMPFLARDEWNAGHFLFNPEDSNYQMTIFDFLEG